MISLFLQRHNVLYDFYLDGMWQFVSPDLMRQRPHPKLNSIAWNLWHIARVEDATLNRFIADRSQVLDEGDWMAHMKIPWRHHGSAMSLDEVDVLSQQIELFALQEYSRTVGARTQEIVQGLDESTLDDLLSEERVRTVLLDEGLAHLQAEGLIANYAGVSKGRMLMNHGLTHSFIHVGEMDVLASLLGMT